LQQWLAEFKDYGTKGFGGIGWYAFLQRMIKADEETITIKRVSPFQRGGSGKNLTSSKDYLFKYDVQINPRDMARRILDVRMHLTTEWLADLDCIKIENSEAVCRHD
jgi:hypothetical protein